MDHHNETFAKFHKILSAHGLHQALRFLNSRTTHRFTGIYEFEPPMLRNRHLVDAYDPGVHKGDDAPLAETYCSIVGQTGESFSTRDASSDSDLLTHPARTSVLSYCGVLLRDEAGKPFGTLCHFDLLPCDVPIQEMPFMQAAAPFIFELIRIA